MILAIFYTPHKITLQDFVKVRASNSHLISQFSTTSARMNTIKQEEIDDFFNFDGIEPVTESHDDFRDLQLDVSEEFLSNFEFEDILKNEGDLDSIDIKEEFILDRHQPVQLEVIKLEQQNDHQVEQQEEQQVEQHAANQENQRRKSPRKRKAKKCHLCSFWDWIVWQ